MANSGGGYSSQVDARTRLDRFLILGAEGGTYYIAERDLVKHHDAIARCIELDGVRAVKRIVEISDSGRAPKNDPTVFANVSLGGGLLLVEVRRIKQFLLDPIGRPATAQMLVRGRSLYMLLKDAMDDEESACWSANWALLLKASPNSYRFEPRCGSS